MVATSDEELYFLAANQRQDLTSDKETMSHTTLQRIFSVINCKSRMERTHGEMSTLNEGRLSLVASLYQSL